MPANQITIIILNWNGKEDTLECLDSLDKIDYPHHEIVVVDNGSTDGSVSAIRQQFPNTHIIETGQNLGFAEGNNVGIHYALESNSDYILVLNNDTWVNRNLLSTLVETACATDNKFVYGPAILYANPEDTIWFAGGKWNQKKLTFDYPLQGEKITNLPADPYETDYICGAALFFHRSIAEKIGFFDKRFFLVWEESDWCYRANNAGYPSLMVPESKIWHKVGVSFGSESSPLRQYFSTRNRLLWIEKNLSQSIAFKTALQSLLATLPSFQLTAHTSTPLRKRLLWSVLAYFKSWQDLTTNKVRKAKLRGATNYLLRKFGDCPASLRK